jgi:hypothetical protein
MTFDTFFRVSLGEGGALWAHWRHGSKCPIDITGSRFNRNVATTNGGGVLLVRYFGIVSDIQAYENR